MPSSIVTPIVNAFPGYHQWLHTEIYTGPTGTGEYVPRPNDTVWDPTMGLYEVESVNLTTNLSILIPVNLAALGGGASNVDVLLGAGPGSPSESFLMYVNTNVVPYQATVDGRCHMYAVDAAYIKIFAGTDTTSATSNVISAVFNTSGELISENIPMQLVTIPGVTNLGIKVPAQAYVTVPLVTGDTVSIVVYTTTGAIRSTYRLVVANTNFIRTIDQSKKTIANISLVSPYLSITDQSLLEVPINMAVGSIPLQGQVVYTDGSSALLPVDGTKFALLGMNAYVNSTLGSEAPLVLRYALANDEYSVAAVGPNPGYSMNQPYRIRATATVGVYSVKLFAIPVWDSTNNIWTLRYYLYNLDRLQVYDVTAQVTAGASGIAFNGALYGVTQNVSVVLNLANVVGAAFSYYMYPQVFQVLLTHAVTTTVQQNYWKITYGTTTYGNNIEASITPDLVNAGLWQLSIASGLNTTADWLAATYYASSPLWDSTAESAPIVPNYVTVQYGSWQQDIALANVLNPIPAVTVHPPSGATILISYLYRQAGQPDQQLAIVPMTVVNV